MKQFATLGGSFDPVHLGHIHLACEARRAVNLDRVIFVPCWRSPFKVQSTASAEHRFEMLRLSILEQGLEQWAQVSTFEISRPGPSYSWQTAEHFRQQNPEVQWNWILGTDQWEQLQNWAEPEKLRNNLHFIVMTRDGDSVTPREGWNHTPVPFSHPASSTKIRQNLSAHKDWLSPAVTAYCERFSLYR